MNKTIAISFAIMATVAGLGSGPSSQSAKDSGRSDATGLLDRADDLFEACQTLLVRAKYHWATTGAMGKGKASLDVHAAMAVGGKYRVVVKRDDDEILGICCDGAEVIEWNGETKRWTRYPVAQRGRLRLTMNMAGQPPVASALSRFAASWVDPSSGFAVNLKSAMSAADTIIMAKMEIADRMCPTIELSRSRPNGALQATENAVLAIDNDNGLPVVEETVVRLKGLLLIPLGTETRRIEYVEVAKNAPLGDDTFSFSPPPGWAFKAAEELKTAAEQIVGQSALEWEFRTLSGDSVSIGELCSRTPVLLVTWATWCAPCKDELTKLRGLHASPEFERRVQVIAVSADRQSETVRDFLKGFPLPFTVAHDPETLERIGLSASLPTTLLIDRQGMITRAWQGWGTNEDAASQFNRAIDALSDDDESGP